ncbi:MAG: MliC family protein [Candidatus Paceibacterota bacterium]|jgi:membrane-bound inhibitor of C-type lysozyme
MNKKILLIILIVLLIIISGFGAWYFINKEKIVQPLKPIAQANYLCNGGKTIDATFYKEEQKPVQPGQPPIPSGSVIVVLSDGRTYNLLQTISADGSRYANSNESFVFWSKGNGALVLENNVEKSYTGCMVLSPDPGGLPQTYSNGTVGFSIRYPANYSINASYVYQELGPGKNISGIKFTIPSSTALGTNLSSFDTGVSIEFIPATQDCNANLFLFGNNNAQNITDNGRDYSFASTTGAGAGNRYEEDVWAIPYTNPCIAVRYLVHSTVLENYPTGTVKIFDRQALLSQFDDIRQTLVTQ